MPPIFLFDFLVNERVLQRITVDHWLNTEPGNSIFDVSNNTFPIPKKEQKPVTVCANKDDMSMTMTMTMTTKQFIFAFNKIYSEHDLSQ